MISMFQGAKRIHALDCPTIVTGITIAERGYNQWPWWQLNLDGRGPSVYWKDVYRIIWLLCQYTERWQAGVNYKNDFVGLCSVHYRCELSYVSLPVEFTHSYLHWKTFVGTNTLAGGGKCRVFKAQADWMLRDVPKTSHRRTLCDPPGKLKVIHSMITWCSVKPLTITETPFCCALFWAFMARVRYNLEQNVFVYDCYVKEK
jgi:hypothetical protein